VNAHAFAGLWAPSPLASMQLPPSVRAGSAVAPSSSAPVTASPFAAVRLCRAKLRWFSMRRRIARACQPVSSLDAGAPRATIVATSFRSPKPFGSSRPSQLTLQRASEVDRTRVRRSSHCVRLEWIPNSAHAVLADPAVSVFAPTLQFGIRLRDDFRDPLKGDLGLPQHAAVAAAPALEVRRIASYKASHERPRTDRPGDQP
jgi:hypothetical protein